MNNPAISVIIPCYNPSKFIKQCVKSVLCQSMTDLEVIVVDDGSTNQKWVNFIERYSNKDHRLQIVRNEHHGITLTRKAGYLLARGEYIFFMDYDDWLPNDALKILYQAAMNSGADVTISNYARVFDSFGIVRIKRTKPNYAVAGELIPKKDVLQVCYGSSLGSDGILVDMEMSTVWGRLYKSDIIRFAIKYSDVDLFPISVRHEDGWFNLALTPYISSVYITNEICYYYRYGGIYNTPSFRQKSNANFFNYRFDQFEKWNFQEGHPRSFATFANVLCDDLKIFILTEKFSKDEIVAFLSEQISSNKIVDWAKNNMTQIESLSQRLIKIATEKPEDIYCWYWNALHSKSARRHQILKKCVLACSKVLDIIYETLY